VELPDWLSKIIVFLLAIAAIYFAFAGMFDPEYTFSRYEKSLIKHLGHLGLFIIWLLAACGCFWAIWHMSKKTNKKYGDD